MVRRDGFSPASFLRFPARQSTYSVESVFVQNRLSSSSFLKSGIFFFTFGIDGAFVLVHVTDRYHTNPNTPTRYDQEPTSRSYSACVPIQIHVVYPQLG